MKTLSKVVVTIVAVIVFFFIFIILNDLSGGHVSILISGPMLLGLIAALKALWKKDTPQSRNDMEHKDIDVSDNDDEIRY